MGNSNSRETLDPATRGSHGPGIRNLPNRKFARRHSSVCMGSSRCIFDLLMHEADSQRRQLLGVWSPVRDRQFLLWRLETEQFIATGVRTTWWSPGGQSMASHLSRTVARKLYSLAGAGRTGGAAGGSLRTLGPASTKAKANWFSTQEFNDASRDAVPELNAEVRESHQDQSDATPEFFSFDSPASPPISAAEIDQPTSQSHNIYSGRAYQPRGVYKAILLGEVGQAPAQRILKNGRAVTIFSVGTGGMHLNRRIFDGETPEEFAERSNVQWHRLAVYQEKLGYFILHSMKQGSQVYVEGNLETRIYNDPNSQKVKRIREIAVRSNGRLLFMDTASTAKESQYFCAGPR